MAEAGGAKSRSFFGTGARAGDVIAGRYAVVSELGAGGMGQVVEVEHLDLEKRFALKLIRPDRWDETLDARFRREARALARVSSVRVAQITDFGLDEERGPFYVMELVEGEPLHALIEREGPLPRGRALELAVGIAEALADVHEAGIVHRDVKPGNIGVCSKGPVEVRLLDFGLATSVDERFGSKITESKRVVGSMPYMAPEQFHGEAPSPSVDLWALGIVTYEMLTGTLPFAAPSTAALIHQILNEAPSLPPAPQRTQGLLSRLLAKDAALRPTSAQQAIELIEDAIANPDPFDDPVSTQQATQVPTDEKTAPGQPIPSEDRAWRLYAATGLGGLGLVALGAAAALLIAPAQVEPVPLDAPAEPGTPRAVATPRVEGERDATDAPPLDRQAEGARALREPPVGGRAIAPVAVPVEPRRGSGERRRGAGRTSPARPGVPGERRRGARAAAPAAPPEPAASPSGSPPRADDSTTSAPNAVGSQPEAEPPERRAPEEPSAPTPWNGTIIESPGG